ncbi:MAG: class I SAM-dependent methyltransferase [Flavobacteriales bacterium]
MHTIYSQNWKDYELIDAGNGKKLERWGTIHTIRPDRNAYFPAVLTEKEWIEKVDFEFIENTSTSGEWIQRTEGIKPEWQIKYGKAVFNIRLTRFKHVGLFPEQQTNWDFLQNKIQKDQKLLNLFGYTGAASVIAKLNHAEVYHCDSVKNVINWGKENMESSGVEGIKWVLEDALKFAQREVKRGNKYKGVIMDPPAFGIGVKKERWKLEDKFTDLLKASRDLIEDKGFIIINTYSPKLSAKEIKGITSSIFSNQKVEISRLSMKTTTGKRLDFGELTRIQF